MLARMSFNTEASDSADYYRAIEYDTGSDRNFRRMMLVAGVTGLVAVIATLGLTWRPPRTVVLDDLVATSLPPTPVCAAPPLPHKYGVEHSTPLSLQKSRGTCWIFATLAVLEQSYRANGVAKGWLKPEEYVRMSPQAYGAAVLDACPAANGTCEALLGDELWDARRSKLVPLDTEGGEPFLLYFLKALQTGGALPDSVCPYIATAGHDHRCPGLKAAQARNPLRFTVSALRSHYERKAVKAALLRGRTLSLSTSMMAVTFLLPCTRATRRVVDGCPASDDDDSCESCPLEPAFTGVGCCIAVSREQASMGGSFFRLPPTSYPEPELEGGHAMGLVGYNDAYRTAHGGVGGAPRAIRRAIRTRNSPRLSPPPSGFIVKNSWWDGVPPGPTWNHARGSHSLGYLLQQHSSADEARVCPNAHAPFYWTQCADLSTCRMAETAALARSAYQPLHLECSDASSTVKGLCAKGDRYFLKSLRQFGASLAVACFIKDEGEASPSDGATPGTVTVAADQSERGALPLVPDGAESGDAAAAAAPSKQPPAPLLCTPPVPQDEIALLFSPVKDELYPNDPDACGYYFFPYELLEEINAKYGGFEVDEMVVEWADEAYAANAADHPELDYELLKKDTRTQRDATFGAPVPQLS